MVGNQHGSISQNAQHNNNLAEFKLLHSFGHLNLVTQVMR